MAGYPKLSQGFSGEAVRVLQRGLALPGAYVGRVDGAFGLLTTEGVKTFQTARELVADGVAGQATWGELISLGLVPDPDQPQAASVVVRFDPALEARPAPDGAGLVSAAGADLSAIMAVLHAFGLMSVAAGFGPFEAEARSVLEGLGDAAGLASVEDFVELHLGAGADPAEVAQQLLALPGVLQAVPSAPIALAGQTLDPLEGLNDQLVLPRPPGIPPTQWYLWRCRADRAWDMVDGTGTTVVVIDSGFFPGHEDLAGNLDAANSADIVSNTSTIPSSGHDHGTCVSGLAAAVGNNATGIAGFAFGARLIMLHVGTSGHHLDPLMVALAVIRATAIPDVGRKVINMSMAQRWHAATGTGQPARAVILEQDPRIKLAIDMAIAAGIPVCCAAGNTPFDATTDPLGNPVPTSSIVVTATDYDPVANPHRPTTAFGARVDMCAPGDGANDITCADPNLSISLFAFPYRTFGDTSGATPKVAGTAALMLSADDQLTAADVKEILKQTGTPHQNQAGQPIGSFLNSEFAVHEALHRRLVREGEAEWRWCKKCQGLHFAGVSKSFCPAGLGHALDGSGNYGLMVNPAIALGQGGWRRCNICTGLFFSGGGGACPGGGSHQEVPGMDYHLSLDGPSAFAQSNWRWCNRCQGLFFNGSGGSICPAGGLHDPTGSGDYMLKLV